VLEIWVVYLNPTDYPGRYVVRRQRAFAGQVEVDPHPAVVAETLDEARAWVPYGLYCQPAHPEDDPAILETWF
jgi:hypothetical protein